MARENEPIVPHHSVQDTRRVLGTITDGPLLLSRLESRPATAPTLDIQEYAVGTVCAAVPLPAGSTGSAAGCLAVSLPLRHLHRLRDAAVTLHRNAAPVLLSLAL